MQITREMRIGAGALAFIGAVVWMLPPTTPVAPMAGRPHAEHAIAVQPSSPVPVTEPAAAVALPETAPGPDAAPIPVESEAMRPAPARASFPPRDRSADDADDDAPPDPAFAMGYHWAEANAIALRRDCRRWRGSAAEAGCRAFLRDGDDRDPDDRDARDDGWEDAPGLGG